MLRFSRMSDGLSSGTHVASAVDGTAGDCTNLATAKQEYHHIRCSTTVRSGADQRESCDSKTAPMAAKWSVTQMTMHTMRMVGMKTKSRKMPTGTWSPRKPVANISIPTESV